MDSAKLREMSKDFYRYLSTEKDVALNTQRAYEGDIKEFLAFLDRSKPDTVDQKVIRAYIAEIYSDLKKSSLSRKISSIKVFFKFLKKKGYIEENPAVLIRNPRIEKHLPKFYTVDEMFHFLDTLPGETWMALRNRAIFELIYSTGMRAQETLDLDVEDVHLEGQWALVKGKGGKERVLPFGEKARDAVAAYLEEIKPQQAGVGQGPVHQPAGVQAFLSGSSEDHEETPVECESFQEPRASRDAGTPSRPTCSMVVRICGAFRSYSAIRSFRRPRNIPISPGPNHGDIRQSPSEKIK